MSLERQPTVSDQIGPQSESGQQEVVTPTELYARLRDLVLKYEPDLIGLPKTSEVDIRGPKYLFGIGFYDRDPKKPRHVVLEIERVVKEREWAFPFPFPSPVTEHVGTFRVQEDGKISAPRQDYSLFPPDPEIPHLTPGGPEPENAVKPDSGKVLATRVSQFLDEELVPRPREHQSRPRRVLGTLGNILVMPPREIKPPQQG